MWIEYKRVKEDNAIWKDERGLVNTEQLISIRTEEGMGSTAIAVNKKKYLLSLPEGLDKIDKTSYFLNLLR